MTHQIDQLKEEIHNKEQALVKGLLNFFLLKLIKYIKTLNYLIKEHSAFQQVEKEKEHLKAELVQLKKESSENKAYIDAQQSEERKLLKIIQEADSERMRQKKQLEQVKIKI